METENKILAILEDASEKVWADYRTVCELSGVEMQMAAAGLSVHYAEIFQAWWLAVEVDSIVEWHKGTV